MKTNLLRVILKLDNPKQTISGKNSREGFIRNPTSNLTITRTLDGAPMVSLRRGLPPEKSKRDTWKGGASGPLLVSLGMSNPRGGYSCLWRAPNHARRWSGRQYTHTQL